MVARKPQNGFSLFQVHVGTRVSDQQSLILAYVPCAEENVAWVDLKKFLASGRGLWFRLCVFHSSTCNLGPIESHFLRQEKGNGGPSSATGSGKDLVLFTLGNPPLGGGRVFCEHRFCTAKGGVGPLYGAVDSPPPNQIFPPLNFVAGK